MKEPVPIDNLDMFTDHEIEQWQLAAQTELDSNVTGIVPASALDVSYSSLKGNTPLDPSRHNQLVICQEHKRLGEDADVSWCDCQLVVRLEDLVGRAR